MVRLSARMAEVLRSIPSDWGRPQWPRWERAGIGRTIDALRRRGLYEFRQIDDPSPNPRFATGKVGQIRLTPAGRALLTQGGTNGK